MVDLRIGCGPYPQKQKRYHETFGCVEITDTFFEPVRESTARRWAGAAPGDFHFVLTAWRWLTLEPLDERGEAPLGRSRGEFGLFRPTDANRAAWDVVSASAVALGAAALLFKTPPTFTPTDANRTNLQTFVGDIVGSRPWNGVWEARGIWQPGEAAAIGDEVGLTVVVDPFAEARFPEPRAGAYYAVTGPHARSRFVEEDLLDLHDFLQGHEGTVHVVFRGDSRVRNAAALARIAQAATGAEPASDGT